MKEMLKTLKKYIPLSLLTILFLVLQVFCDLSLPSYTSNIVDIGIARSGIEYASYEKVSKDTLNRIFTFMDEKEKDQVLAKYTLENNVYTLKKLNKQERKNLGETMAPYIVLSNTLNDKSTKEERISSMELLLKKSFSEIEEMAIVPIKQEYKKLDLDLSKMQMNYIYKIGAKMLALTFLSMIFTILSIYTASRMATGYARDLREKCVKKILFFSKEEYDSFETSSLITRSTNDISQIQLLLIMLFRIMIYAPILALGAIRKVFGSHLFYIIASAVFLTLLVVFFFFFLTLPKFKSLQEKIDNLNKIARERLGGLFVIRAFNNEKKEEKRFDLVNKDLQKTNLFINKTLSALIPSLNLIINLSVLFIVLVGAYQVNQYKIQVGDILATITYSIQIITAFIMMSMLSMILPRGMVSFKRVGEVLSKKTDKEEKQHSKKIEEKQVTIQFKNISYKYKNAKKEALSHVSFTLSPGLHVLVGSVGSGKTTCVSLLLKQLKPTNGKIYLNNIELQEISKTDLYQDVRVVLQKESFFKGTLKENITLYNQNLSTKKINQAIKDASFFEYVSTNKKKLNTEIAQGARNLSGGQRQRLALSRAFASNFKVLILDDSFSALDYQTEAKINKVLKALAKEKTILIITNRLGIVKEASQILVLDNGKLVGKGTHKDLMKTSKVYQEILSFQIQEKEAENE